MPANTRRGRLTVLRMYTSYRTHYSQNTTTCVIFFHNIIKNISLIICVGIVGIYMVDVAG